MNRPSIATDGEGLVRAAGRSFVTAFAAAMRCVRMYPSDNPVVKKAIAEVHAAASALAGDGVMELRIAGEFLFVNGVRLRLGLDNYATVAFLVAQCRASGTGGIRAASYAGVEGWLALVTGLGAPAGDDPEIRHLTLRQRLAAVSGDAFELEPPVAAEATTGAPQESARDLAKGAYAQSVAVAAEVMRAIERGGSPNLRALKRTVQLIVDRILTDEGSMLGLTTVRDYEDATFTHAANVCIFSVALGRRLGLSRTQLYDLGLAAMFHDAGKSRIPPEVLGKSKALTADDWRIITGHTWLGLLTLFNLRENQEYPYRAMLVAYEHHLKADGGGYPRRLRPRTPGLFSRIVSVIEMFDAATTNLGYRTPARLPADYVAEMRRTADAFLDPVCVTAFCDMVGMYPVGSLLLLDTYELAVSRCINPDPSLPDRPLVFVISTPSGDLIHPGIEVDLGERHPDGRFVRSVLDVMDAEKYGVRIGDYFVV